MSSPIRSHSGILFISEAMVNDSFPTALFRFNDFGHPFRLGRWTSDGVTLFM